MKLKINLIIGVFISILFTSCANNDWYTNVNTKVENKTDLNFLVYLDYSLDTIHFHDRLASIIPSNTYQVIDSYILDWPFSTGAPIHGFDLWIYNTKDSTYIKFIANDFDDSKNKYCKQNGSTTKQINPLIIHDFYVTINDSLITKMTKNTHLTDSIFGLKKK